MSDKRIIIRSVISFVLICPYCAEQMIDQLTGSRLFLSDVFDRKSITCQNCDSELPTPIKQSYGYSLKE